MKNKASKPRDQRLSSSDKEKNDKQWYKDMANRLDSRRSMVIRKDGMTERDRMQRNYDLINGKLDVEKFKYIFNPRGDKELQLPAKMTHKDITSGKIKTVLGIEASRPYIWRAVAVNKDATTMREKEEMGQIHEYVEGRIMAPVRKAAIMNHQKELGGRELTENERRQIQQQIEAEVKAMTPDEVKIYMMRKYQTPIEVMLNQILEYFHKDLNLKHKFQLAIKHGLASAYEVMYVGIVGNKPDTWNVSSKRINCERSADCVFIQDSESISCEFRLTPSEIVSYFGDDLKDKQIDEIYASCPIYGAYNGGDSADLWHQIDNSRENGLENDGITLSVIHCVWKSLRQIGFLKFEKADGTIEEKFIVDENYKLNKDAGDIEIEWKWIPESYEAWKIKASAEPIYVKMRPIPGQFKDLNNLRKCKLPYYGVIIDNMESEPTSMSDHLWIWNVYADIIFFRLENLLATDKGKILAINPTMFNIKGGLDLNKTMNYMESIKQLYLNPNEEGNTAADGNMSNAVQVLDLSLASDIKKYIELFEYVRVQAGKSVGIPEQMEGQIETSEAVGNTQLAMQQGSAILRPYFDLHDILKRDVLEALLEMAKVAYHDQPEKKLSYVLDDMSIKTLTIDTSLLDNATFGIFLSNSPKIEETKMAIRQLAHAALQNQAAELSDVLSIIQEEDITIATEKLKLAEQKRKEYDQQLQQQQIDANSNEAEKEREMERERHEQAKEIIILKERERRETEVIKASIMGASFNPEQDVDNDGVNDFIEIARHGLDADIKRSQIDLERSKLEHQKKVDKRKLEQEDQKIINDRKKIASDRVKKKAKTT